MSKFGIDTSRWQGDFDFAQARDSEGIEFAIIKAGGADDGLYKDREFENSYNKLNEAGIHKGAYFFGNALSIDEAVNEARYFAQLLAGKSFCYPVFYDVEAAMVTGNDITDIIMAFLDEMRNAGYSNVGLYSYENCINNYVDISRVKDSGYAVWVAKYSSFEPNIASNYDIWQFGGGVNFLRDTQINGQTVDQNYCYTDFCEEHVIDEVTVPDYQPVSSGTFHKGDTVRVVNAVQYDNSGSFATYYDEYTVISVSGSRVVIGIDGVVTAAVHEDNLSLVNCVEGEVNIEPCNTADGNGKTVRVLDNIDYSGNRFTVYYDSYDVIEENGDRIVIGIGSTVTAAVNIANLEFIGGISNDNSDDTPTEIPFSESISEDSTVRFIGSTDYDGTSITAWHDEYIVSELSGDRAVLTHDGDIFAAVNVNDCELI